MSHNKFGSDYPPGVTSRDIEGAYESDGSDGDEFDGSTTESQLISAVHDADDKLVVLADQVTDFLHGDDTSALAHTVFAVIQAIQAEIYYLVDYSTWSIADLQDALVKRQNEEYKGE